ncbi:MAG: hypothetical protein ABEK12_03745, partial [Candidatus Nanohaloarchaea archaeon]
EGIEEEKEKEKEKEKERAVKTAGERENGERRYETATVMLQPRVDQARSGVSSSIRPESSTSISSSGSPSP